RRSPAGHQKYHTAGRADGSECRDATRDCTLADTSFDSTRRRGDSGSARSRPAVAHRSRRWRRADRHRAVGNRGWELPCRLGAWRVADPVRLLVESLSERGGSNLGSRQRNKARPANRFETDETDLAAGRLLVGLDRQSDLLTT